MTHYRLLGTTSPGHATPLGATGSDKRHGIMHDRELRYDNRVNSTKVFVLLAAVVEWAQPLIRAEIDRRRAERDPVCRKG